MGNKTLERSPTGRTLSVLSQYAGQGIGLPEHLLVFLVRSTADAVIGRAEDGTIVSWNPGAERVYGYSAAEAIGEPISLLSPTHQAGDVPRLLEHSRDGGSSTLYETIRKRKDGSLIPVTMSVSAVRDSRGNAAGSLIVSREAVTSPPAQTPAPGPLAPEPRLLDLAPCGICRFDAAGRFLYANQALARILGCASAEEVLLLDPKTQLFRDPEACARFFQPSPNPAGGMATAANWRKADGSPIHVQLTSFVARNDRNEPAGYEVFVEDTGERPLRDAQLRQAQTMDALGRLAGKVAHDFNNVLGVIVGYTQLLHERLEPHDILHYSLEQIVNTVDQAASLTRQLLGFSRKLTLEPRVFSPAARLLALRRRLEVLLGESARLVLRPGSQHGCIRADAAALDQVILNLAAYGREAMPSGGSLTIELANVAFTNPRDSLPPGAYLRLAVTDTGPAIGPQELGRVFEPFLSTPSRSNGNGLGLATVYEIVRQSGGYIWVESGPGQGATFIIHFPLVAEEAATPPPAGARAGSLQRRKSPPASRKWPENRTR